MGGVARTIAEEANAHVTGIDLTRQFCNVANMISGWVGLGEKRNFVQASALSLSFPDEHFDCAVTVHACMNIPDKRSVYREAFTVLETGARFGMYDIVQGEGGKVFYPAPWAMDPSISHLATPREMAGLLQEAGFRIVCEEDTTLESYIWLENRIRQPGKDAALPMTTQILFGSSAKDMTKNQLRGLAERRMLTYRFVCVA